MPLERYRTETHTRISVTISVVSWGYLTQVTCLLRRDELILKVRTSSSSHTGSAEKYITAAQNESDHKRATFSLSHNTVRSSTTHHAQLITNSAGEPDEQDQWQQPRRARCQDFAAAGKMRNVNQTNKTSKEMSLHGSGWPHPLLFFEP